MPDYSVWGVSDFLTGKIQLNEPLAKLVSGDWLPLFGLFPDWNFAPWNHHAFDSIPKIDPK